MCDKKWIVYDSWWQPAQWLYREEAPEHLPKPNLHQKKVMVTGGMLPIWSTTVFWILVKPLYLRSRFNKLVRCTKNCNACNWYWSTERAQFFFMTAPDYTMHSCFKSWTDLPHLPYSPDPLPANYHFFKHLGNFLQGKCFHSQQEAENAFQEFLKSWSMDIYTTGINKLISLWQKCVDCIVSYFDK